MSTAELHMFWTESGRITCEGTRCNHEADASVSSSAHRGWRAEKADSSGPMRPRRGGRKQLGRGPLTSPALRAQASYCFAQVPDRRPACQLR